MYPKESIILKPNAEGVKAVNKKVIAGYYAHITALNDCFGQLMKTLEEQGLKDDTVVLFTRDHGDMLFSQDRGWKLKPWLESVNIPFIIGWPGHIPAGRKSKGQIGLVDVMPSLVSLVGEKSVEGAEGKDLSRLLLGDETNSPESSFIGFYVVPDSFSYNEWRGIITKKYTYARFREEPWILYNDEEDPQQLNNLVNKNSSKDLQEKLEEKLQNWLKNLGDPFESSTQVANKYIPGHKGGVKPHYENDVIRNIKRKRNSVFLKVKKRIKRIFKK